MTDQEKKETRRKRYAERAHQRLYEKILNDELFSISDVAKIFNKKTSTIRRWEAQGIIPKVKKYAKNEEYSEDELHTRRKYTKEELLEVITNVLDNDWTYNTLDRENLENIQNYLRLQISISNTTRSREAPAYYER